MSIQSTHNDEESGDLPVVESSSNMDNNVNKDTVTDDSAKNSDMQEATPLRPLTGKERAYIKFRIDNPTATKPEAIRAVYDVKEGVKNKTLRNMATTLEKRPSVLAILSKHAEEAEETLADVMKTSRTFASTGTKEGATYAGVAEKTANSILDRLHGKARQTVDITSTSVNLSIDLGSMGE